MQARTVRVDTLAAVEALRKDKMFTKEQAKAIVDRIQSVELYDVASSGDIQRLEKATTKVRTEVQQFEAKLESKIDILKRDLTIQVWIVGTVAVSVLAAMKYFG